MVDAVETANAASVRWLAPPAVAKILRARDSPTNAGKFVWTDQNTIAGYRAEASTACPASTLIAGDFSQAVIGIWGGIGVEVDPYGAGFKTGSFRARVVAIVDCGLLTPAAFSVASSVS